MEKDPRDVIIRPVITEHSYDAMENNVYTFEVAKDANKVEIRQAIEAIFNVKVVKVNTLNVKSSAHRAKGRKPEKPRPAPAKGPAFLLRAVARGGFLPCRSVVSDIFPSLATGVLRTRLSCEAVTRHLLDKLKVMPR